MHTILNIQWHTINECTRDALAFISIKILLKQFFLIHFLLACYFIRLKRKIIFVLCDVQAALCVSSLI